MRCDRRRLGGTRTLGVHLLVLTSVLVPLAAGAQLEPLALDNEPAPDSDADYSSLGVPHLNTSEDVAFSASLSGGSTIGGVFLETEEGGSGIALRGDPAPGAGSATFVNFGGVRVNASGDVAFQATLQGGTASAGIFLHSDDVLSAIALVGDSAPGTSGGTYSSLSFPGLSDAAEVAFSATIAGSIFVDGVFRRSSGGGIAAVALTGDAVPGAPGALFTDFVAPAMGADGTVAFKATYIGSATGNEGVFRDRMGSLSAVLLEGDTAPGTGGSAYLSPSSFRPGVSESGDVAFISGFSGGKTSGSGIFRDANGVQSEVIFLADPIPGSGSTIVGFQDGPETNDAGDVVFVVNLASGGRAVAVDRSGTIETVALNGDAASGTVTGSFSSFGNRATVNAAGSIAFSATVSGGFANSGIWLLPEPAGAQLAAVVLSLLAVLRRRRRSASPARG